MKYNNYMKYSLFVVILILTGSLFTACSDDDVKVATINEHDYETSKEALGYVINDEGKRSTAIVEFRNKGNADLYLALSKDAPGNVDAVFKFDKAILDAYNAASGSSYELFPEGLVSFAENGSVTLEAGNKKSEAMSVTFKTSASLNPDVTYVVPVKLEVKSTNVKLSEEESSYLIFVKDLTNIPDVGKSTGIKIISCMEINDTNPLNNLCFTLKKSGKPLIDVVILFSANINYSKETGEVYVFQNPEVTHLLANRDKYIKPLQDKGMKVVLGILGNHDRSGVANLSDDTAKKFAKELKAFCDAYKLDGIFFDDEYSSYMTPAPAGFVTPSSVAASRLHYETHMAMPDRIVATYAYSRTRTLYEVDGILPGEYLSYGIHDYGNSWDLAEGTAPSYKGMPKSNQALYSQEFNLRRGIATEDQLKRLRDEGYGSHMIFAMDPKRANFDTGEKFTQKGAMERIAKVLFDDELVYDGKPYSKDW